MNTWISVKDALPKIGSIVIATGIDYGKGQDRHYEIAQMGELNIFYARGDEDEYSEYLEYITHWMPLPEPPKEN